jgi:tetratricopeptide (TPR) repeat protein
VYRYVQLLVNMRRVDDAIAVAETAQKLDPYNTQFAYLIGNLNNIRAQSEAMGQSTAQLEADVTKLEKQIKPDSTNFVEQAELAQKLMQLGQNDRAYKALDDIVNNPKVPVDMVMQVAEAYSHLGQPTRLQNALEVLARLAPDSPEAWYDLAASHALLGQDSQAIDCLKKSIELNNKRLAKDPKARDLRPSLQADTRFAKLRDTAAYKALPTH